MKSAMIAAILLFLFAASACQKAALRYSPEASLEAGRAAYEVGDYEKALVELTPLAYQGYAGAQTMLGTMYWLGLGVIEDNVQAATWLRKAADQGNSQAKLTLAILYLTGQGVPRDFNEAFTLLRQPAEEGIVDAQFYLGMLYLDGEGVSRDRVQAYMWLDLAASRGKKGAAKMLESLAGEMTPEQIAHAQEMARNWKPRPSR